MFSQPSATVELDNDEVIQLYIEEGEGFCLFLVLLPAFDLYFVPFCTSENQQEHQCC